MITNNKNNKSSVKFGTLGIFVDNIVPICDTSVIITEINGLVANRAYLKISQMDMAESCKVSLRTIKRFEKMEVDSLSLYLNYKEILR